MPPALSKKQVMSELFETLDNNDIRGFTAQVRIAREIGADFNEPYGQETGYKTILQLAIEEEDGALYVEELLKTGASASFYNIKSGGCPIHAAASQTSPVMLKLLLKYPSNKADVNVYNTEGLSAFHILMVQLMDLAAYESLPISSRGNNPMTDDMIVESMSKIFSCLLIIVKQRDLRLDFNYGYPNIPYLEKSGKSLKKLSVMTPLQILCSFQSWNAKCINDTLHLQLEQLVQEILDRPGVDPNATAVRGALAGTVAGSTPPVLLAATRGYYKVVDVFKSYYSTNFLVENKFHQTILHVVLKAGYYNKLVVYGDESASTNIQTIRVLFSDDNLTVQAQMRSIINRKDTYGNTALHYAKSYPDQSIVKYLLYQGAKIDVNPQKMVNVHQRTIEEYFYEKCIIVEGDDIDDEDFRIRINFKLFEKPFVEAGDNLELAKDKANAWSLEVEKKKTGVIPSSGKVDTARLEHFGDMDSLHDLLKHPVLVAFLELELRSLKIWYILDFFLYLIFVVILFVSLTNKYGVFDVISQDNAATIVVSNSDFDLTYYVLFLAICVFFLIVREIWQMFKMKLKYFSSWENGMEWFVIALVILNIIPLKYLKFLGTQNLHRHLSALTLLIAFTQLYMLLVKVFPTTSIPIYVNMFTTVTRTYFYILFSYLAFIMSFAYSFFLIFGGQDKNSVPSANVNGTSTDNTTATYSEVQVPVNPLFANLGVSFIKTLVMLVGEFNYSSDLNFTHWLGYVIFALFVFLVVIVLMNVLNGLAVRDISLIMEEMDTYHNISIVETLSSTIFLRLVAQEILIFPNTKPKRQTFLKIPIMGQKVYKSFGGKENFDIKEGKTFYFKESTVKGAKELVALKQKQSQNLGKVTLENVSDSVLELKRDFQQQRTRLANLEENINTILEIMISRNPNVGRF